MAYCKDGLRRSVELSDKDALEWTLETLDEDKDVENFAERVPGFFDSKAVPDPTSAILPLMANSLSQRPNPSLDSVSAISSRCVYQEHRPSPKRSARTNSDPLPPYICIVFANPDMTHRFQAEEDLAARVIGRCFGALGVRVKEGELACLSAILGIESRSVMFLLGQPGAIELASIVSLISASADPLVQVGDTMPSDVLNVFKETLSVRAEPLLAGGRANLPQPQVENFHKIYSKAPNWLKDELKPISDRVLTAIAAFPEPQAAEDSAPLLHLKSNVGLGPAAQMASSHKAPAQNRPKPALPPTPKVLRALVSKIDAKTLHAYVLAHLPTAPPDTLVALASFFATLRPAPRLHCVRCHSDYIEVENDDRSCHVPHDEDSGDIERVGGIGRNGIEYETHFSCCGKIVEGDEDPPDGWCYEGMHTTDVKRARFRADSTSDDDMLEFCDELDCHVIGAPPWQPRATDDDDDDNASRYTEAGPVVVEIVRTVGAMGQKTVGPRRTKATARKVTAGTLAQSRVRIDASRGTSGAESSKAGKVRSPPASAPAAGTSAPAGKARKRRKVAGAE
ncbi:hypothetical protein EDB86DRAFT_3105013 [Lactarius hatsudake]|nr:hypothetical protein EDB86DRAFT_3105013 [Lactarius hatsudake]